MLYSLQGKISLMRSQKEPEQRAILSESIQGYTRMMTFSSMFFSHVEAVKQVTLYLLTLTAKVIVEGLPDI